MPGKTIRAETVGNSIRSTKEFSNQSRSLGTTDDVLLPWMLSSRARVETVAVRIPESDEVNFRGERFFERLKFRVNCESAVLDAKGLVSSLELAELRCLSRVKRLEEPEYVTVWSVPTLVNVSRDTNVRGCPVSF